VLFVSFLGYDCFYSLLRCLSSFSFFFASAVTRSLLVIPSFRRSSLLMQLCLPFISLILLSVYSLLRFLRSPPFWSFSALSLLVLLSSPVFSTSFARLFMSSCSVSLSASLFPLLFIPWLFFFRMVRLLLGFFLSDSFLSTLIVSLCVPFLLPTSRACALCSTVCLPSFCSFVSVSFWSLLPRSFFVLRHFRFDSLLCIYSVSFSRNLSAVGYWFCPPLLCLLLHSSFLLTHLTYLLHL